MFVPRVDNRRSFAPLLLALIAIAWLSLFIWGESPYGRFLRHDELGHVDIGLNAEGVGIALVFIAAGLLSHAIHEFIEIGALGSGPWTATAFDISGVLSHDDGIGAFLRALFGYSASPEILTLAVHLTYVVAILALYLRPVQRMAPPSQRPAPVQS